MLSTTDFGTGLAAVGGERRRAIERLVLDLRKESEALEDAMREELTRSSTSKLSDAQYPMATRQMGARLANLRSTIATLQAAAFIAT